MTTKQLTIICIVLVLIQATSVFLSAAYSLWWLNEKEMRIDGLTESRDRYHSYNAGWHDEAEWASVIVAEFEHPCKRLWNCSEDWEQSVKEGGYDYGGPSFWTDEYKERYHEYKAANQ